MFCISMSVNDYCRESKTDTEDWSIHADLFKGSNELYFDNFYYIYQSQGFIQVSG